MIRWGIGIGIDISGGGREKDIKIQRKSTEDKDKEVEEVGGGRYGIRRYKGTLCINNTLSS